MVRKQSYRYLAILFYIAFSSVSVFAQTPAERHQQIRAATDAGDLKRALAELSALRSMDAALFQTNNYDYLQARLAQLNGDGGEATAAYQSVLAHNSALSQYALWHLAQSARSIGDLVLERERLRQLIISAPASLLRESAMFRLGESFFESEDYASAVTALEPLNQTKNVATARQAQVLIGRSYARQGKLAEARNVFAKLIMQMPDASKPDDFALAAVRALDEMEAGQNGGKSLPEAEHLLRASIYQFNRDFAGARLHYLALAEQSPQSTPVPNALYQLGRGLYLEAKYDEALKYFQRVVQEFPNSSSTRDALTSIAATYNRLNRPDEAIQTYRRLAERFPDPQNPERAYLNIIDLLHEAGRHPEALEWVQQTRRQFKGHIGDALALFAQLRIHRAQGNWTAVIPEVDELLKMPDLGGTRIPGGTTKAELVFIRGHALEQLGRSDEAVTEYLSLPDGRNEYYGGRATDRLLALAANPKTQNQVETRLQALRADARKALETGLPDQAHTAAQQALRLTPDPATIADLQNAVERAYASLPAYKVQSFKLAPLGRSEVLPATTSASPTEPPHSTIAAELFFLGLYDEAVPEFTAARSSPASALQPEKRAEPAAQPAAVAGLSDIDYTIAFYSLRGGLPNRAVRFAEQLWKNLPSDYLVDVAPPELVELLYPVPYRDSLLKHAPARSVDARFVLSIARQESRFQADAKSIAAARGMLQFIPATADEIAVQLGRKPSNHDELYNPDTAILFGSQYLSNLFKRFPDQPQAVAASYNGGPDNTARWIARSRSSEADRYLPEIGFSQTKDYVYKVMSNYRMYMQLYDAQLQRKARPNR
ncbi:MAG TPA: transglycosylase SLT domain-containing protein [Pyrinomonadaceae bacterium]|nr:transglycosylase SLT domain-containing protein [Pyrinomonadaceae bacterium]